MISSAALAQNATTAGTASAPYPTLENVSLEWAITGDADNDGVVKVRYRKAGTTAWLDGLPLVRVPAGANQGFSWQNRHAGSVFGLLPGASYEAIFRHGNRQSARFAVLAAADPTTITID